jgi:hypothetical protein
MPEFPRGNWAVNYWIGWMKQSNEIIAGLVIARKIINYRFHFFTGQFLITANYLDLF